MAGQDATPLSGSDLAAFAVAMEVGSVHGAADALALTPSAVTKRIQSLERRLGVQLFDRGRFGLRPTGAARLLYPDAKQALLALRRAETAVSEHRAQAAAVLSLAASHTIGEFLVPGWLAAFRAAQPALRAQVDIVNSTGVLAALRDRVADVGFVEGLDPLDGLEALTVLRDEIVVVVAAGHRWARRRSIAARELAAEPYLTREAGSGTRAVAAAALAAAGVRLTPALEFASFQSLKRAVAAGGFTLLSRLVVDAEVAAGTVRAVPLRDGGVHRELRAVRLPGRAPAAAAAFWRWLEASAREPGAT
jgi:DNA-binding transcriptional LysR family regulator